jgi:hypothetical protein
LKVHPSKSAAPHAATLVGVTSLLLFTGCQKPPQTDVAHASSGSGILRLDPALDSLVPPSAELEKLATGFQFTEGPLWFSAGYLWFSDVIGNVVR